LSFANNQLKDFGDINAKLNEDFTNIKAKLRESAEEVERLRIEGEQHIMKLNDTIQNKELQVSDLLEKFQNERNFASGKLETNDFRDFDNMEGGLIDVKKQLSFAAKKIKNCPKCAEELYQKLDNASQQLSAISQAICASSSTSYGGILPLHQLSINSDKTGRPMNTIANAVGQNGSIVDIEMFRRCESEEQLLDAPGDIDSDLSSGKTSQFTRHTTTIEINTSPKDFYDSSNSEDRVVVSKRDSPNNKKDILDGMQHHLKQMEQELAIVGEESKELQQRLSIRQEELEKKCIEVRELAGLVDHLRHANVRITEQLERSKNRTEAISCRLDESRANFRQLEAKAANKDFLIITIIDMLLTQIEETHCNRNSKTVDSVGMPISSPDKSASYFVQKLRQTTVRPSKLRGCGLIAGKGGGDHIDFNLEILCCYIESEGRRRRRENYCDDGRLYAETPMQEDKSKKASNAMFSLSTFSSKSKESSSFLKSSNRASCHQNQQPVSFSGIPTDAAGLRSSNTRPLGSHITIGANEANEDKKYPLLNSAGVSPTLMTPNNFRVTRRVGSDSLLVAWTTPDDDEITGYLIYVDGELHQKVRSSSRTKALLHDLNLNSKLKLGIHSIGMSGTVSNITFAIYDPKICVRRSASFSTTHPSMSTASKRCK
jgi:hypothetical protein